MNIQAKNLNAASQCSLPGSTIPLVQKAEKSCQLFFKQLHILHIVPHDHSDIETPDTVSKL